MPNGGPKDTKPPKVVRCVPANRSVNFSSQTVTITFNKFVQLRDADNQIFISPSLNKKTVFKTKGKSVVITFKSPLRANTTYTINFGEAIIDITEGNKLENFSYVFSTGTYLDSMGISGHVHYAFNNSTEKGILVMLYDTITDSIVHSRPLYFSRTDSSGKFKMRNLKIGTYKLVALKDMNANYKYDLPNESIAFCDTPIVINDTTRVYELALFTALPPKQHFLGAHSYDFGKVRFDFARNADSIHIMPIDTAAGDSLYYKEYSMGKDTITAWLNDVRTKTIKFIVIGKGLPDTANVYMKTIDSMKQVKPHWQTNLVSGSSKSLMLPFNSPVILHLNYPFKSYNKNTVIITDDSIKKTFTASLSDSMPDKRKMYIKFPFKEGRKYHVVIPAQSLVDIYGIANDTAKLFFQTQTAEDAGNLDIKITVPVSDDSWFLQVFDDGGNLIVQHPLKFAQTNTVSFTGLQPAKYSARVIEDHNHNGRWDTGDYWHHIQPEKVFQYSNAINVRPNWDLEAEIKIP
jgi:uncharacterized protein (DUF2141 family)